MATTKKGAAKKAAAKKTTKGRQPKAQSGRAAAAAELARRVGVPVAKLSNADTEKIVVESRKMMLEALDGEADFDSLPVDATPEEYTQMAGYYFSLMVLFTGKTPKLNMRAEMMRFMAALREVQKHLPKGKREPADEHVAAMVLFKGGLNWPAIYPQVLSSKILLDKTKSPEAKRKLRRGVKALIRTRAKREQERGGNTTQK